MRTPRPALLAAPLLLVGLVAACGDDDDGDPVGAASDGPRIVVTTGILGDVVGEVVGDSAVVEVMIPAGVDPHEFAPSARQAAELREADLVVANGLGLESGLDAALDAAADDGVPVLELAEQLDPLPFGADEHDHDEDEAEHADDEAHDEDEAEDDHGHGDEDPHFWHDPQRMADAVPLIVDALLDASPDLDAAALQERADTVVADLETLDAEVEEILAAVPAERRILVTNHDTMGYFAERYDFEVLGAIIPGGDTLSQPSARDLADLAAEIEAHDLPAIFAETVADSNLADALAAEVGRDVAVVQLFTDALGEPGSGADTYVGMLRTNAESIAEALG